MSFFYQSGKVITRAKAFGIILFIGENSEGRGTIQKTNPNSPRLKVYLANQTLGLAAVEKKTLLLGLARLHAAWDMVSLVNYAVI